MSATSVRGKAAIKRAGTVEAAIDESCHRIVYFQRMGFKNLEAMEQQTLKWLQTKKEEMA